MQFHILALIILFLPVTLFGENIYLSGGVAAADREWTGSDYTAFSSAIKSGKIPVPLLRDEYGGEIIRRFCNTENLSFAKSTVLPLSTRLNDFLEIHMSASELANIYVKKAVDGEKVGGELSLLLGFLLHSSVTGIALADEFVSTMEKDSLYETRMNGLRQMRSGLTTTFIGTYKSIAEDAIYTPEQRSHLIDQVALTAQRFAQLLPPNTRLEMIAKFTELSKRVWSVKDRQSFETIIQELKKE